MHADDVAGIADTVDDSQVVANKWQHGMRQNGMKINTRNGKSELMIISRRGEQYDVLID